jgi:hypothetical protein
MSGITRSICSIATARTGLSDVRYVTPGSLLYSIDASEINGASITSTKADRSF